jgi:hypothetical protein
MFKHALMILMLMTGLAYGVTPPRVPGLIPSRAEFVEPPATEQATSTATTQAATIPMEKPALPVFKVAKANAAVAAFEANIKKAEKAYTDSLVQARTIYVQQLKEQMKLALKANDVDLPEVNKMDAAIKEAESGIFVAASPETKPETKTKEEKGIVIVKATYCAADKSVSEDITESVRRAMTVDKLSLRRPFDGYKDIAFGKEKLITVHFKINGVDLWMQSGSDRPHDIRLLGGKAP